MSLLEGRHLAPVPTGPVARPSDAPETPGSPRRRGGLGRRPGPAVWVGLAAALVALVHVANLNGWPAYFDDEGTYVAQAWAVYQGDLAHYTYWYDHPPAGWLQLASFLGLPTLVGVEPSITAARYVMVLYTVVTALLVYRLSRNLGLRRGFSLGAMLLWGLSPLVVFEGRQVMLDNLTLPWVVGAMALVTSPRRNLWQYVGAGVCFGVAVLTKETAVLAAPALLVGLWAYAYRPTRAFGVVGALMASGLVVGLYPLYALLKLELFAGPDHVSVQDAVLFQLVDRGGSGNFWQVGSDAYTVLDSWLFYDELLPIGGVVAGLVCLAVPRLRCVGVLVTTMAVVALRPGGYMPVMYVIGVLPFAAVAIAGIADRATTAVASRGPRLRLAGRAGLVAALLAVVAWTGPTHADRIELALTDEGTEPYDSAVAWMDANLERDTRIAASDSYWSTLVNLGWSSDGWSGPIWAYKLDGDPIARRANLPDGWRSVDYLVLDRTILDSRLTLESKPQLSRAIRHSEPVAEWGERSTLVQIRRVVDGPAQTKLYDVWRRAQ